jgi:non-specific serine/threonine protein kinase
MSVFIDGWDQEAAAFVAGIPVEDALPVLAALTEKHVIRSAELAVDGEPRFGLLDTLKSFAGSRITKRDLADARQRHGEHYLALAELADQALIGPDQRTWLDRLERELGNLRAALRWFIDAHQPANALRLAAALWFFWDMRGHLREGQRWLEAALEQAADESSTERAGALSAAGWLALVQHGSYEQAISTLEVARSTAHEIGDTERLVRAEGFLGLALALGTKDFTRAEQVLASAVDGSRAVGDNWALALALYGQGHLGLVQGQGERCQERWQTCAAVAQSVGNLYGLSYLQFRWGLIALLKVDLERASACLVESLRLSAELDSIREMAVAIGALVLVAAAGGDVQRAGKLVGCTQALLDRAGCDLPAFLRGEYDKGVAGLKARLGGAVFEDLLLAGRAISAEAILADTWQNQGSAASSGIERSAPVLEPYAPLSAREWEIARHVARGSRNREIAKALVLTERTVGSHLERIYARLHIRNRAQLAAWVAERAATAVVREIAEGPLAEQSVAAQSRQRSRQLRVLG